MLEIMALINQGEIKKALNILTNEKGINLKFLCKEAELNYHLIQKFNSGVVADIGADKKEALKNAITNLYI